MNIRVNDGTETIKTFTVRLPEGEIELVEIPNAFKSKYQKSLKTIFAIPQAISRYKNKLGRDDFVASKPFLSEEKLREFCYNNSYHFKEGKRLVHTKVEVMTNDEDHIELIKKTIKALIKKGVTSHVDIAEYLNDNEILTKRNKLWTRSNLAEFTRRYV